MSLLVLHVIGGAIAIASGLVALFALKGAQLHRKSGSARFGGCAKHLHDKSGGVAVVSALCGRYAYLGKVPVKNVGAMKR